MPADTSGRPPLRGRAAPLLVCGLLAGLAVAGGAGLILSSTRAKAIADGERELSNLALGLAEQADRDFQSVELIQTSLLKEMQEAGVASEAGFVARASARGMHDELKARIAPIPLVDAITMIDRNGKLLNFSRYWPIPPVNVADRDYFAALSQDGAPPLFISRPVPNRGTGTWTIYLAHRVEGPDGQFLGLVLGAMQLHYFEQFFGRLTLGEGSAISLFRRDGVMLARYPGGSGGVGHSFGPARVFQDLMRATNAEVVRTRSPVDGRDRFAAVQTLNHYPMAVIVSRTAQAVLRDWYRQVWYVGGAVLLIELVIGGIVFLGVRQILTQDLMSQMRASRAEAEHARRLVEAELNLLAERSRAELELQAQHVRFGVALDYMLQGLCMFDGGGRLMAANARFGALLCLDPADLRPGRMLAELIGGADAAACPTGIGTRLRRLSGLTTPVTELWDLEDGRTLSVACGPMEKGGWLATFEDITDRRAAEAKIVHMAHHDALTGLPNRVRLHEELRQAVARVRRGERCAVLCLDLDRFKDVNDTLGHPAGDALLQAATVRLRDCVRETDMVARLGGDEFAIVQCLAEQPVSATDLAQRLIEALSIPFDIDGHHVVIGTSIGVAIAPQDGIDPDELLKNADLALYRAKKDGRGVCRFFEPEMDARMQARRATELDLRRALTAEEFEVFYQPFVDLRTSGITGFEALIRWRHPERGLVPPGEFVPLAEEIGLIVPIGEWVLRRACAEAAAWPDAIRLAVNLSPAQFRSRSLVQMVVGALESSGLAPERLELEITETVVLQDTESTLETLHLLRGRGVRISLDDFGTGYSSLSYLQKFPFDKIKIDRSFVMDLGRNGDSGAIVRAVAGLGANLGIRTTAEGIETEEQMAEALSEGCTEGQGYLFSRPRPAGEVAGLLRASMLEPAV